MAFENPKLSHAQLRHLAELLWASGITRLSHNFDVEEGTTEGWIDCEYYDNFGHLTHANVARDGKG